MHGKKNQQQKIRSDGLIKVVILAAGQSKRMDPLPDKNFIKFCGRELILWQVQQLRDAGFREIVVVGGRHNLEELRSIASNNDRRAPSKKLNFSYERAKPLFEVLEQKKLEDGMAGAVLTAEKWVGDSPFLVVSSNDIVEDSIFEILKRAMKRADKDALGFLVAKKVSEYFPGGYLKIAGGDKGSGKNIVSGVVITGIVEKPGAGKEPSDLVNIVFHLHMHPKKLFAALKSVKTNRDDRYEVALDFLMRGNLGPTMRQHSSAGASYVALPYSGLWQPIKYPWHLISVWKIIFDRMVQRESGARISKKASVAKSALIRGDVIIEDDVKIFDHAVIQGPAYIGKGSIVANNALVRESHLGAESVAGYSTEIARSFLADGVWTHTNYIGDSIIGSNTSFGSGTVTGNLRLDEKNILVCVGGNASAEKIDCGTNKLGAIVGENVRVGINVSIMPGVKIGNNCFVGAGIALAQDMADGKFATGKWELTMRDNLATMSPSARQIMMRKLKQ